MNWTEGALARHSRRKGWDKDAARQKQYFAKARAKKNAPSSSKGLDIVSFVPDYIKQPQPQQPQDHYSTSSTPAKKQKTPKRKLIHIQHDTSEAPRRGLVQGINIELPKPGSGLSPVLHSEKDDQELDIATKRRKLLEKDDWMGVSTQKPLKVNYAWRKDCSPQPRGTSNFKQNITSLLPTYDQHDHSNRRTLGRLSNNEMRINIGSQNLRWSRESNSVRSFATRQGLPNHISSSPDRSLNLGLISPYQLPSDVQAPKTATIKPRKCDRSPGRLDPRNKLFSLSNGALDTAHRNSNQKLSRREGPDEPRFVAKAHIPMIHQPQPIRETRPSMINIRSPDFEDNMSTTAVLGAPRRSSNRITPEDIRWNLWLNPKTTTASSEPAQTNEVREPSRPISPGISQFWNSSEKHSQTQSPAQPRTPPHRSLGQIDEPQLQSCETWTSHVFSSDNIQNKILSSEPGLPEVQAEGDLTTPTALQTRESLKNPDHDRREARVKPRSDWILPARKNTRKTNNFRDMLDLLTENEDKNGAVTEKHVKEKTTLNSEDEDEIWKRFVFDNDPAETTRKALDEANEQTKRELGLKTTTGPCAFQDLPIASSSTAPRSDVAEPPSATRDSSLSTKQTPCIADDQIGVPLGTGPDLDLEEQSLSEVTANADTADGIDSIVAQPSSPEPLQAEFTFHQPQLFIGRLAADAPSNIPSVTLYGPKKGRRRRKHRDKARPDFRAMPDYDDDPIEED
ncbi:hypothetical protein FPSE_01221 [Fusarium pseudograminearum CS3096]|uniref:Uncharacterized protein n=1 Tax=Fusarium pseudograminearum (strain CS3096) TaxID=1028729 RepID=K3VSF3_FUSPC|nr:hypothetical protein FPSE_01221 [Fusarium pseudograminearum CS3096]EKJ78627.1 hypothetical protein FPSE_01221 [Fusarium pseudograminearum CS3096]KAF0643712.1 hypothetical protein FPSE5266_01221 [Fusarium pseudograminearum]